MPGHLAVLLHGLESRHRAAEAALGVSSEAKAPRGGRGSFVQDAGFGRRRLKDSAEGGRGRDHVRLVGGRAGRRLWRRLWLRLWGGRRLGLIVRIGVVRVWRGRGADVIEGREARAWRRPRRWRWRGALAARAAVVAVVADVADGVLGAFTAVVTVVVGAVVAVLDARACIRREWRRRRRIRPGRARRQCRPRRRARRWRRRVHVAARPAVLAVGAAHAEAILGTGPTVIAIVVGGKGGGASAGVGARAGGLWVSRGGWRRLRWRGRRRGPWRRRRRGRWAWRRGWRARGHRAAEGDVDATHPVTVGARSSVDARIAGSPTAGAP